MVFGEVAQLGERRVRNAKVGSSILLFSTTSLKGAFRGAFFFRSVRLAVLKASLDSSQAMMIRWRRAYWSVDRVPITPDRNANAGIHCRND